MSVLRDLQGITYWVIEDPLEIARLVDNNIRKEWESDVADGEDPEQGTWLGSLLRRDWRLDVVEMDRIKLNKRIMNYANSTTGYSFRADLDKRKRVLGSDVDRYGAVITPVVVRAEDNQLMDGYCRYHVLLDRGVTRIYSYVGSLRP